MHRKRSRLQGGHRVGLTQPAFGQTNSGPAQGFSTQYGAPTQPRPPPSPHNQQQPMIPQQQLQHQQHQQQQQQQPDNSWGWDGESSGAWNWGEGGEGWSSATQHSQQQQQQQPQQQQEPQQHYPQQQHQQHYPQQQQQRYPQQYSQPLAYPHQPPQPSIQQQFVKPAEVTTYSHMQHPATSQPQQQYMNGSSQNGNSVDDWGNWGDDWGSADTYNNNINNNNNKPAMYGKQESINEQPQNYPSYQQFQQQQQQQPQQQQQQPQQHQPQQQQQQHQQQQHQQQQGQQQQQQHQQEKYHQEQDDQLHYHQYTAQQQQDTPQQQPVENSQSHSEQEYSSHFQHHPAQPQQEATQQQQAGDDNWGWGTDDEWQVNGQVNEHSQEMAVQQASQPVKEAPSCEVAAEGETTAAQPAVSTANSAEDGWPEWEEQTLTAASHTSQQQQQEEAQRHSAESTTYSGSEEKVQTQQDASHWTHQQWEGGWGHLDTQETPADHHSVTHTVADFPVTTTTTGEHQSYGQYDSYQQELIEGGGTYTPPEEQHHQSAQKDHQHSTTTASESGVMHSQGVTTTATGSHTSTLTMNNFDDDNWGDGWGEMEPPQPPHNSTELATQQPSMADAHGYDSHCAEEKQPTSVGESTPHNPECTHPEIPQHSQSYSDQPYQESPDDKGLPEEPCPSTYPYEGTLEGWDSGWDEEGDKMTESVSENAPAAASSEYSLHTVTKELDGLTLQTQPPAEGSFSVSSLSGESCSHPSASEGSFNHSSVTEESFSKSSTNEESYTKSSATEESYSKSSTAEESYTHSTVTEDSLSQSTTTEASYLQHPGSNDSYIYPSGDGASYQPQYSDISSYSRTSEGSSRHHGSEESYLHSTAVEESSHHQTPNEGGFTPPQPSLNTQHSPITYLELGTEGPVASEPHPEVTAPAHHIPASQPPPTHPQHPPTHHYPPQEHPYHQTHTTHDQDGMREIPHMHHPSPSPSPHNTHHPHTHHPSPSASPHIIPPHLHHPSPAPSPHTALHHPSPSPSPHQAPHPHSLPSPSPSPHLPVSHPHQAQEVNQEVAPPPPHPPPAVPDPIYSRIPDGASSIPEGPTALAGMASNRQGQGQATESSWPAGSTGSSVSGPEVPLEHQAALHHPAHLSHPPVDRPASNQSAHSVHSVHSIRSTQSSQSAQSSQSLPMNQEVPLDEEAETQASHTLTGHPRELAGSVPNAGANRPSWEGAAAPPILPMAPPQGTGPNGAIQSLKARKGSPFQPPSGKEVVAPSSAQPQSYQFFTPSQPTAGDAIPAKPAATYPDVSANLETLPDNNELINSTTEQSGPPLWSTTDPRMDIKLAVAAPPSDTTPAQVPPPSNPIPVVVPGLVKEEKIKEEPMSPQQLTHGTLSEPPAAHSASLPAGVAKPKMQPFSPLAGGGCSPSPAALDLSMPPRVPLEPTTAEDRPHGERDTPNFSRMVPGESRKGESAAAAPPTFQTPAVVPSMPSERVVTGNDNPQPVVSVGIKQEPSEVRSPPDGPDTSRLPSQAAPMVVPPIRSETIGSEEPKLRNFASGNSGSRSDLSGERGERGSGRWERDHSRDRGGDAGSHRGASDRYRDRSRERGSTRDYYRDDSPQSRRSYDRDYDDRRRWRGRDSDEDEDSDRRYYDSRDRRERAYRDEMDRYSDRPSREEGKERRDGSSSKRRDYKDRSKDSYRGGYDDDPYFGGGSGRGDRSQPMSRSSSINNLDEAESRSSHHHHPRSHHHSDYYDRRDLRSRDSDPRDRDSYGSRDHRDYYSRGWDSRDARRDHQRYYGAPRGYEDMYEQYHQYYQYNQYYKDYYQWMKQYRQAYQSESFYDDRTSIHSGRSSVNNEPEKSVSSGELSGVPSVADDAVSEVAQRMTPAHFGRPHISARFTPTGQMVLVLPKDPRDGEKAVVQLRNVQKMLALDPAESKAIMQMKNYPGPLTLTDTHKDVVMRHCEHKVAEAARSLTLPDKESVMLIWEYLALLVKQNGKLFGSDIASLLLKGREVGPPSTHTATHTEEPTEEEHIDNSPQDEGIDLPSQPPAPPPARDEAALLKKFTEYLCLGRKKEAVDYAIQEGLWGHALALAYKMDSTTHTRVLAAFMSHIPHTDVVLTLFQQLSGKKPDITKNYSPEQWGDWRQHLAVMISNPTGASHKDCASIVALGDTLAARGQLHAAHFCYLVAGVDWGSYACKDSKLVLIGASHLLPFQAFATVEAIQCTEVYEFARSLDGNNSPSLDTFQSYKLVYALRLTECGFPAEALRYCEVISQAVEKNPTAYKVEFLSQVHELACHLKYHDLHYQMYQGEVSEIPDPQWLSNLRDVLDAARHREHQQVMELQDTARTEGMGLYTYQQEQVTENPNQTLAVDPTYTMANTTQNNASHMDQQSMNYGVSGSQSYPQVDPAYTTQPSPDVPDSSENTSSPHSHSKGADSSSMSLSHPQGVMSLPQEEGIPAVEPPVMSQPSPEHLHYAQDTSGYQTTYQQHESYLHPTSQTNAYDQGSAGGEQQNMSGNMPLIQPSNQGCYPGYQQQQPYQPWGQPQPTEGGGAAPQPDPPSVSPETQVSQTQRTPEEEAYWEEMSNKKTGGGSSSNNEASMKETKAEENKKSAGKESKSSAPNKGGWLTSLWGWKKSTPQAVLPDDKNPKIVWDENKKTWVNTDGSDETSAAVGPPPKIPQTIRGPLPSVSRSGNRMTRYVDPVRDKAGGSPGGTQPPPMLPPMPMPSVSPSLMMPQPMQPSQEGAEAGNSSPQPQPPLQPQPQQQPTVPGPVPAPAPAPEVAQGTLSEEEAREAVPMMAPPMGQPQFFNPSQFKPPSSTPANPARRTGPGRRSFPANR